jgi:hypothetical protein
MARKEFHMDPETTRALAKAAGATARTAGQALEIVHDTGGYLSRVFGNVPEDVVGVCGGAWLHERHIRLRERLRRRTELILQERDVQEVIELSPNLAMELIAGAQEEGCEELMELWARLLANAMDPNLNSVRHSFIDAVKRMDPLDAVVLRYIYEAKISTAQPGRIDEASATAGLVNIASAIDRRADEIEVSLRHLHELQLVDAVPPYGWNVNAISREFMRACYPEVKTE